MSVRGRLAGPWRRLLQSLLLTGPLASASAAHAQAPPSSVDGWDNAYYQILAESLRRAGRGKWVYTSDGHPIGHIADVHTAPDGVHEVAVVRVRRLLRGGEIALPVYRSSRQNGRIVSAEDRPTIRAMARVDVAAGDGRP
ncbi:hypothetical protein M446_1198 [Methylobacterium sp. 4-46]|uniref:hypothetical protein n=1 Tax=unclassified Methylobacterium TaxID=2615210 RepID=UPI000152C814|nr:MULTISPECIES: hypothetical protein [Methylobacterium]ACA15723.1 hypothetical protein M446_1198 [Methylobacterium sp. 4-46]WFT81456.1 hypothetical protein QA634_06095 [Methylobacterium nodulans]